ncbi:MAG TPA: endolytic transglycosylase MltG [Gemmatimonadaceae bacterium]|nr:endolytic transglycosylase MltG [Gemmatimonadaceae bacterium]
MSWDARARIGLSLVAWATLTLLSACKRNEVPLQRVTIPPGATMRAVAESLKSGGLIGSPRLFAFYAKLRRSDRGMKPGTYLMRRDESWGGLLSALRTGRGVVNVVTVPEGFTLAQIEQVLIAKLGISPDSFRAAVTDTALLDRLGAPTPIAEGYLFPDTYFFSPGTSARAAVRAMVRRFEQQWRVEWGARLDSLGRTRHEVLTMASIVEREAKRPEERPVIASVYWNRLRRGMLLQADPTVQYALPQYQKRLLNKHLAVKSRYNTYQYRGLPPGPIGSPGTASIRAALYPADVPYLYFVAYPDGHHEFRTRLEQHQAAVRDSRRAWDVVRRQQRADSVRMAREGMARRSGL